MATPIPVNRAAFTLEAAAAATGGAIVRHAPPRAGTEQRRAAIGVFTDSRAVQLGSLFVALRGDTHDGHAFLDDVCRHGPSFVVVERGRAPSDPGVGVLEVEDTLVALGALARAHLVAWRAAGHRRVVAITGSAGKTTTKELTAALLGAVGTTHHTAGNLNNRIGVPLVVLGVQAEHRFVVLEMGMSLPGELDAIASFAHPDVAMVTNVGVAHSEGVGGASGVMREKGAVYRALDEDGIAIVNADDALAKKAAGGTRAGSKLTFGLGAEADYRLTKREVDPDGGAVLTLACSRDDLGFPDREIEIRFPLSGEAAAIDLAAALAAQEAASGVELSAARIEAALAKISLVGRGSIARLGQGIVVIDDTYNANPASMTAALTTLTEIAGDRRRVVVLGEMKELGAEALAAHDALGDAIVAAGVSLAIGCGGLVDRALARAGSLSPDLEVVTTSSTVDAAREAVARVRPRDAVLVKGSRSVGAERVVSALTEAWPSAAISAVSQGGDSPEGRTGRGEPQR